MADVAVTMPDGSKRVVDDTQLRPVPAQEWPLGSFATVTATGGDETWWRTPAGAWAPTDDPTNQQAFAFLIARDTASQPALIYAGGRRVAEALAAQVVADHVRVLTAGGNHIRVAKAGASVGIAFNAVTDILARPAAAALGLVLLSDALGGP